MNGLDLEQPTFPSAGRDHDAGTTADGSASTNGLYPHHQMQHQHLAPHQNHSTTQWSPGHDRQRDVQDVAMPKLPSAREEDAASEAETLIDSPVKHRVLGEHKVRAIVEKPQKSRIGGLPVPADDDDDEEAKSIDSSSVIDVRSDSRHHANNAQDDSEDDNADKDFGSDDLSSQRWPSRPHSPVSSRSRATTERADATEHRSRSPNPRKRKHRASSVTFPNKRRSMDPPPRKLRGMYSEGNAAASDRSPSPRARKHRRSISTQSVAVEGSMGSNHRTSRVAIHGAARDTRASRNGYEESDGSSETASRGQDDHRRPQRGVGRATSTPGRPQPREQKRHVNKYGFTRLAEACESGDLDLVKEWREKDPDQLELAEYAGNTPLQVAALHGNSNVVSYLIDQGCKIDCANSEMDTPLIDAAENGHLEVVQLLLDAGVDPLRQNRRGEQALDVVEADDIRALLRRFIDKWNSSEARKRREEEEEQRHRAGPSKEVDFMERTAENLLRLVQINDRNGVQAFLEGGVGVDNTILTAAAKTGDNYLVSMLLANMTKKKASQKSEKPVLGVLGTSHIEMLKFLTTLDTFNPLYRNRAGKTWSEIAEEKNGPMLKDEKEHLLKLYEEANENKSRKSSSPVTKRENGKRKFAHRAHDEDSDAEEMPNRKNGRRLMSRRDMRAANGKGQSDSSDDESISEAEPTLENGSEPSSTVHVAQSQHATDGIDARTVPSENDRTRSEKSPGSAKLQMCTEPVAQQGRGQDHVDDTGWKEAEEQLERKQREAEEAEEKAKERQAEIEATAKREAEQARRAEEERKAEQLQREAEIQRQEEARQAEQARKAEEDRMAEEARKAEEDRRRREQEEHDAKVTAWLKKKTAVVENLPDVVARVLSPVSHKDFQSSTDRIHLIEHFTPLHVLRTVSPSSVKADWVLNLQVAALIDPKDGLESLMPREDLWGGEHKLVHQLPTQALNRANQFLLDRVLADLVLRPAPDAEDQHQNGLDSRADSIQATKRVELLRAKEKALQSSLVRLELVELNDVKRFFRPFLRTESLRLQYHVLPDERAPSHPHNIRLELDGRRLYDFVDRLRLYSQRQRENLAGYADAHDQAEDRMDVALATDVVVVHDKRIGLAHVA